MQGQLQSYTGSCHCGAIRFEVKTTLSPALRCNCSLCRRKGALMASVAAEDFTLLAGETFLTLYQFNTRTAKHYFCKICGIYPFHRPRTDPTIYRVNVGCLDGVDLGALNSSVHNGAALTSIEDR